MSLFPEFELFVKESGLDSYKGALAASLPRILGGGTTKALGLDLPPAPIERRQELIRLTLPGGITFPSAVADEIAAAKSLVEAELREWKSEEGSRRQCSRALQDIKAASEVPIGIKDNFFFADRLVLVPDRRKESWSWSITAHYPVISKIPCDRDYIVQAFFAAQKKVRELLMREDVFLSKLEWAWEMARHFSAGDDSVLIIDVARMFLVAAQADLFWNAPKRQSFVDKPEAVFIVNFLEWKTRAVSGEKPQFEITPATVHQAHGRDSKAFTLPLNREGTQTRPYLHMLKHF